MRTATKCQGVGNARNQVELSPDRPEDDKVEVVSEITARGHVIDVPSKWQGTSKHVRPDTNEENERDNLGALPLDIIEQLGKLKSDKDGSDVLRRKILTARHTSGISILRYIAFPIKVRFVK